MPKIRKYVDHIHQKATQSLLKRGLMVTDYIRVSPF